MDQRELERSLDRMLYQSPMPRRFLKLYAYPGHFGVNEASWGLEAYLDIIG